MLKSMIPLFSVQRLISPRLLEKLPLISPEPKTSAVAKESLKFLPGHKESSFNPILQIRTSQSIHDIPDPNSPAYEQWERDFLKTVENIAKIIKENTEQDSSR